MDFVSVKGCCCGLEVSNEIRFVDTCRRMHGTFAGWLFVVKTLARSQLTFMCAVACNCSVSERAELKSSKRAIFSCSEQQTQVSATTSCLILVVSCHSLESMQTWLTTMLHLHTCAAENEILLVVNDYCNAEIYVLCRTVADAAGPVKAVRECASSDGTGTDADIPQFKHKSAPAAVPVRPRPGTRTVVKVR